MPAKEPGEVLTLQRARSALEAWARTTWWRRRELAERLEVDSFERSGAYHVVFESFTEKRVTRSTHTPYHGGPIEGPADGKAPGAWEIAVQMPALFRDTYREYEVPYTSEVRTCHRCSGMGRMSCPACDGSGRQTCSTCGGSGSVTMTRLVPRSVPGGGTTLDTQIHTAGCSCVGGTVSCSECDGDGWATCNICTGARHLRHYLGLEVSWRTVTSSDVIENTGLPDELITEGEGDIVLQEEAIRVPASAGGGAPYRGEPLRIDRRVDSLVRRMIASYALPPRVKLHRQRLTVRAVPVHEGTYRWGRDLRFFWIYGRDDGVYAPYYPLSLLRIAAVAGLGLSFLAGMAAALILA